jgi:molybdopterin converting factor small subunit
MPAKNPAAVTAVGVKIWAIPELLAVLGNKEELEIEFEGNTVGELLRNLFGRIAPEKRGVYLNDQGDIVRGLVIVHNGKALPDLDKFGHLLRDGDTVGVALTYG